MSEQNNPFVSVQPENRTIIEESLEYAWHTAINSLSDPYPELKQPLYCPDEFVALLADERGVLDWQPGDTLEQQRKTANKAFDIHRMAGTRQGLVEALGVLGVGAVIQRGGKPYSIEISAEVPDGRLTPELHQRLTQRVVSYKSERDSVSLETVRSSTTAVNIGVLAETGVISDSEPYTFDQLESIADFRIGVLAESYVISDSEAAYQ